MTTRTPVEIKQRLRYAAWFGSRSEAMHCYGCGEFEMCRMAYNGGAHMNFGACASCRAIAERRETPQEFEAERDRAVQLLADAAQHVGALVSPAIAPFISGWLAKVASIAATQQRRDDFEVYVDKKALGLAQHVMGVTA